jgi:hypothetical protein
LWVSDVAQLLPNGLDRQTTVCLASDPNEFLVESAFYSLLNYSTPSMPNLKDLLRMAHPFIVHHSLLSSWLLPAVCAHPGRDNNVAYVCNVVNAACNAVDTTACYADGQR